MATEHVAFKGRGPVRFAPYTKPQNLQRLGNNASLEFAITVDEQSLPDYESEGGGLAAQDSEVTDVTVGMNLVSRSAGTQALGFRATVRDAPTAPITDEQKHAFVGALTLLEYNPDKGQAVTVAENGGTWTLNTAYKAATATQLADFVTATGRILECTTAGTSGPTEPTWPGVTGQTVTDGTVVWTDRGDVSSLTPGTDFNVSRGGITVPESGSKIVDGMPIKVSYTPHANQKLIDALKEAGQEFRMVFDGMNRAKDNRPCVIIMWRAKFAPTDGSNFISEEFGELPISASLLKDPNVPAEGATSQYFQIRWQDAA